MIASLLSVLFRGLVRVAPKTAPYVVRTCLQLNTLSYDLADRYAPRCETDGIHPKHRLMQYAEWFCQQLKPTDRVLDIGCNKGTMTAKLAKHCAHVTGIDIVPENIEGAKKQNAAGNIAYICADATQHQLDSQVDVIVLSNVLEHIMHRPAFLRKIYEQQSKQSPPTLLLRVPMFERDWITPYKKDQGLEWRLDLTHEIEHTQEQLTEELANAGLRIQHLTIRFGEFWAIVHKAA